MNPKHLIPILFGVGWTVFAGFALWFIGYWGSLDNAEHLPVEPWWYHFQSFVLRNIVLASILGIPIWVAAFFTSPHSWKIIAGALLVLTSSSIVGQIQGKMALEYSDFGYVSFPLWAYPAGEYVGVPATPAFNTWLWTDDNQQQVDAYADYLQQQGVDDVLPLPELLSAARDWQKCSVTPFILPPKDKWQNMVNTLKLLRQLQAANTSATGRSICVSNPQRMSSKPSPSCANTGGNTAHNRQWA